MWGSIKKCGAVVSPVTTTAPHFLLLSFEGQDPILS